MGLTPSPTELTTAATDAALGLLAAAIAVAFARTGVKRSFRITIWTSVFVLLAVGSLLGAIAHGVDLSPSTRAALWQPLYLSLGLTVALFFVGALRDWRGDTAARAALPWALALGTAFFVYVRRSDDFTVFIAYEAVAVIATLAIYIHLWVSRRLTGAATIALGVALTLVASAVQVSSSMLWPFDHNGLFHLVQMVALVVIARGLRARDPDRAAPARLY